MAAAAYDGVCDNIAHAVVPVNSKSERVGSEGPTQCICNKLIAGIKKPYINKLCKSNTTDPSLGHNCARSRSQHEADNQSSSAAVSAKHGIGDGRLLDTRGNVHIAVLDDEVNRQRNSVKRRRK